MLRHFLGPASTLLRYRRRPSSVPFSENLIESINRRTLHIGQDMTVRVHRHLDGAMAETFLHDLGVDALLQEQGCMRMTQPMEGESLTDVAFLQQGLKISAGEVRWTERFAERTGEDEIVPMEHIAEAFGVFFLPYLVGTQLFYVLGHQCNVAAAFHRLRRLEDRTLADHMGERTADVQGTLIEVDVFPLEAENLSLPQPCVCRQGNQLRHHPPHVGMVDFESGVDEPVNLGVRQYDDFFFHQFWRACPLDWIAL